MKRFLILALAVLCLLAGCKAGSKEPGTTDEVRVVSKNGTEVTPQHHRIHAFSGKLAADLERYSIERILEELKDSEPIAAPFTINVERAAYSVYDLQGNELSYRSESLQVPDTAGTYVCVFEASLGTESDWAGYQFFFKFTV